MIRPGDIGFGGKRKGFYPNAVRFFTRSRWSHCFVVTPPFLGELSVLEADLKVQIVPFQKEYVEKDADYYEIWRPIAASDSDLWGAASKTWIESAGSVYGFLSIPWFAIRAILALAKVRLTKNWFPEGEICSETLWQFIDNLGGEYKKLVSTFGENETSPQDLYALVTSRPDLFEFVMKRD